MYCVYELADFGGFPMFSCVIRKLKDCMDRSHSQSRALEGTHEYERPQILHVTSFSANAYLIGFQGHGVPLPTHSLICLPCSLSPLLLHSLFSTLPSWFSPSVMLSAGCLCFACAGPPAWSSLPTIGLFISLIPDLPLVLVIIPFWMPSLTASNPLP